jgi:hypothetical protein
MIKINFDFPFKGLDGLPAGERTVAKTLADFLAGRTPGIAPAKAFAWAVSLHDDGEILIDKSDSEALERCVLESDNFTNLGKAQITEIIQAARKQAEKPKEKK